MIQQKGKELLFGLVFTLLLFGVLDYFFPNAHWLIRIFIVLVLFSMGMVIFRLLFHQQKDQHSLKRKD